MELESSVTYLYCNTNVVKANIEILLDNTKRKKFVINCMSQYISDYKYINIILGQSAIVHIDRLPFSTITLQYIDNKWDINYAGESVQDLIILPTWNELTSSDKMLTSNDMSIFVILSSKNNLYHFYVYKSWFITGKTGIENVKTMYAQKNIRHNMNEIHVDLTKQYTHKEFDSIMNDFVDTVKPEI
jgi:hypothetical protein